MILLFWIIAAWEIYIRLFQWMDCPLEQASEICLFFIKVMISMFSWRNIYLWKTYLFFQLFLQSKLFGVSMLMNFLSWTLYYAYRICSNSHLVAIQKVRMLWMEGEGVLQNRAKKYNGRWSLKSVRTPILFLKRCFHIFNAYFCFLLL